jgi:hypothetical protein
MARPTKYTEETIKRLEHAISLGASYGQACAYAGISDETFRLWREAKVGFLGRLQKAEGQAVVGWLNTIESAAASGQWQAAAWKLERRYPDEFARRDRLDVEQRGRVHHQHEHSGRVDLALASDDELDVLERLARKSAANGHAR